MCYELAWLSCNLLWLWREVGNDSRDKVFPPTAALLLGLGDILLLEPSLNDFLHRRDAFATLLYDVVSLPERRTHTVRVSIGELELTVHLDGFTVKRDLRAFAGGLQHLDAHLH